MYTASSSVSAPPRPLRPLGAGGGPYLAPRAAPQASAPGRTQIGRA
ncbi:phosphotransferase, partial [Streptomyces sp. FT05W]